MEGMPEQEKPNSSIPKELLGNGRKNSFGRPLGIDPITAEKVYTEEEVAFMSAIDRYKREAHRPFPTCSEILAIAKAIGYRKIAKSELI